MATEPNRESMSTSGLAPRRRHRARLDRSIHSGRVLATLREALLVHLPAGAPLVEARLAEELGVSRGPIRSALHVLESEGLVQSLPNGRTIVVGMSDADIRDLFRVRLEFESLAVEWGLEREASADHIREALEAMEAEGRSTPHLVELDIEFHYALVELSGSPALQRSWATSSPLIQTLITVGNRTLSESEPASDFEWILHTHRSVIEAIAARDAARVRTVLTEQFEVAIALLEQVRATSAT